MKRVTVLLMILFLFGLGLGGQVILSRHRPGTAPVAQEGMLATLGGFRSLAAEVIWWRAERLQAEGRFGELVELTTLLTGLQPHDGEVWSYAAHNLAYNVSVRMPKLEDRWNWVYRSVRMLRDDALRWNPGDPDICREIATLYQLKIGLRENDEAAPLYQAEWRKLVEDAAARDDWASLGFSPDVMAEVEAAYGVKNWANPQASALYWAHLGLKRADARQRVQLMIVISQAKPLYRRAEEANAVAS